VRVALGVEYSGADFFGFQRQTTTDNTVQGKLEKALSEIAREPISLVCAFRSSRCQAHNPVRTVDSIEWRRHGSLVAMQIRANAFLHHMVRNIVGSLIEVGLGRYDDLWLKNVLAAKDRCQAGPTAPPCGLYLTEVQYPQAFQLPRLPVGPAFFVWDDHSAI